MNSLPVLVDSFQRRVTYLRLSLTDRCNYRCTYCMPPEGIEVSPKSEVLSFEDIERLVGIFAGLGVDRVRLTGGEPTVRKDVVEIVRRVAAVPGVREVMMTTNGHRLCELARPMRDAGLGRINISLDTLDAHKFAVITRKADGFEHVSAGIDEACRVGFTAVKLNVVALKGFNDGELGAICEYAWRRGAVPRFIEWMPMSDGQLYAPGSLLSAAEIRAGIESQLSTQLAPASSAAPGSGPARYWKAAGGGEVGIISAMTEHFCETCNRVRVSATGRLYTCLAREDGCDLRAPLRAGEDAQVARAICDALVIKREGHEFQVTGAGAARKHMVAIGG